MYRRADLITAPTAGIVDDAGAACPTPAARRVACGRSSTSIGSTCGPPAAGDGARRCDCCTRGPSGWRRGSTCWSRRRELAGPGGGPDDDRRRRSRRRRDPRALVRDGRRENVAMLGVVAAQRSPPCTRETTRAPCCCATCRSSPGRCRRRCSRRWRPDGRCCCRARASRPIRRGAGAGLVVAPGDAASLADGDPASARDRACALRLRRARGGRMREAHFGADRAAQAWGAQLSAAVSAESPDGAAAEADPGQLLQARVERIERQRAAVVAAGRRRSRRRAPRSRRAPRASPSSAGSSDSASCSSRYAAGRSPIVSMRRGLEIVRRHGPRVEVAAAVRAADSSAARVVDDRPRALDVGVREEQREHGDDRGRSSPRHAQRVRPAPRAASGGARPVAQSPRRGPVASPAATCAAASDSAKMPIAVSPGSARSSRPCSVRSAPRPPPPGRQRAGGCGL